MNRAAKISIGAAIAAVAGGLLWLIGHCNHKDLSRPFTSMPWTGKGVSYVVCLDCGKEFDFNLKTLQVGEERAKIRHKNI